MQTKVILDILSDVFEWPPMLRGQRRWARFVAIIASAMKYLALPLRNLTTSNSKIRSVQRRATYHGSSVQVWLKVCKPDLSKILWRVLSVMRKVQRLMKANTATYGPKWRNGRRRGFKIPRREACRFESGLGYQIYFICMIYRTDM